MNKPLTPAEAIAKATAEKSTLQNFGVPAGTGKGRGGILMPKTACKFRVLFGDYEQDDTIRLTQQVESVQRPSFTLDDEPQQLIVKFRDDVTNSAALVLKKLAHSGETFDIAIEILDGGGTATKDAGVLERMKYIGCSILFVDYSDLDYASTATIYMTVGFSYNSMDHQLFNAEWDDVAIPEDIDLETAKKLLKKLLAEKEEKGKV